MGLSQDHELENFTHAYLCVDVGIRDLKTLAAISDSTHPLFLDSSIQQAIYTQDPIQVCASTPNVYHLAYTQLDDYYKPMFFNHLLDYVIQDMSLTSPEYFNDLQNTIGTRYLTKKEPGIWLYTQGGERKPQALLSDFLQEILTQRLANRDPVDSDTEIPSTITHTLLHIINPAYPSELHLYIQECMNILPVKRHLHISHACAVCIAHDKLGLCAVLDVGHRQLSWTLIHYYENHLQVLDEYHSLSLGTHHLYRVFLNQILQSNHVQYSSLDPLLQSNIEQYLHDLIENYLPVILDASFQDKYDEYIQSKQANLHKDFLLSFEYLYAASHQYLKSVNQQIHIWAQQSLSKNTIRMSTLRFIYVHGQLNSQTHLYLTKYFTSSQVMLTSSEQTLKGALKYALSTHKTQPIFIQTYNHYEFYLSEIKKEDDINIQLKKIFQEEYDIQQDHLLIHQNTQLPTQAYYDFTHDQSIPSFIIYRVSNSGIKQCVLTSHYTNNLAYLSISYDGIHTDITAYDLDLNPQEASTLPWKLYGATFS